MSRQDASEFCRPFGYSLREIERGQEMCDDGFTVSVRLDAGEKISEVYAWARPVMKQSDSMHPDAWNDGWLDEPNAKKLKEFLQKIRDPEDPFGKRKLRCGPAKEECNGEEYEKDVI
jgi:hypothetical protein